MQTDFNFTRGNAILASAVFESFCRIEKMDCHSRVFMRMDTFCEEAGTCYSRWLTAAFLFSLQIAEELDSMVDWDRVDGVFTYEHLEVRQGPNIRLCNSLPAALWGAMTLDRWADMAESATPCDKEWLRARIYAWAQANSVPLLPVVPDHEMGVAELEEKYGREHPVHTKAQWRDSVAAGYCLGYWDWVKQNALIEIP